MAEDLTYNAAVRREQGGDRLAVGSGGELDIESGGELNVESGGALKLAGTQVTATAAQLNAAGSNTGTVAAGTHTVTAAEASDGTLDIDTGLSAVTAFIPMVLDSGNNVVTADADVTISGGTVTIADGSTYATTESEVIHWIAVGTA